MRWGILGPGNIAVKFATTVNSMKEEGQQLVAVASRNGKRAQEFADRFQVPYCFDSYQEMLDSDQIDAVYIATPNNLHYEHTKMCLNAGKHVLCEKPFTTNASQAEKLYALAKQKDLFVMEAFWIRFLPVLRKMQELINAGTIGKVQYVRSEYGFIAKGARRERKFASELGGGALLDIGIYNLGFMQMVMEKQPIDVRSQVHLNEYGTDDYSVIQLRFSEDQMAVVTTSIGMNMERRATVVGTKGYLELADFQKAEKMYLHTEDGREEEIEIPFEYSGFEYEIREVQDCVDRRQTSSEIYTPYMSVSTLKLLDQIRDQWNMRFSFEK